MKTERKNVCAARAVTDEVYELHHAACQREREAAESYSGRDGGRAPPSGQTPQLHTNTCCSFSGCNKFSFHVSLYVSSIIIIIKCVSFSVLFYINCGILSLFSCISVLLHSFSNLFFRRCSETVHWLRIAAVEDLSYLIVFNVV